jgi:hypothetical protein
MTYKPEFNINEKSPGVWHEVRRLEAEVERLRARYDARVEEWQEDCRLRDEAEAEVERLREETELAEAVIVNFTNEAAELEAEVERLTALNVSGNAYAAAVEQNERLRTTAEDQAGSLLRMSREVERLREEGIAGRDTAYRRRDAAEAEVERLQGLLLRQTQLNEETFKELARLRAEVRFLNEREFETARNDALTEEKE